MTERRIPPFIINIINRDDMNKHHKLAAILSYIIAGYGINKRYYILGSYGLRHLREISDLDVSMFKDEFDKLGEEFGIIEPYKGQTRWFWDLTEEYQKVDPDAEDFSIEIFRKGINEGYPTSEYSVKYLADNDCLSIDEYGHHYMNLETLLKWKQEMGREKDQADIALIRDLLQ